MKHLLWLAAALPALAGCAAPSETSRPAAGLRWPSRLTLSFESGLGATFHLVGATFRVDGESALECDAGEGRYETDRPVLVHDGPILSGDLLLEVDLRYRGHGSGVFSYLSGYRFGVRAEHRFEAPPDGLARLHVVAFERDGATTPLEDRPAIRFEPGGPDLPTPPACPARAPTGGP